MSTKERIYWIFPFSRCSGRSSTTTWTASSSSTATTGTSRPAWSPPRSCRTSRRKKVTLRVRVVEGPQFRTGTVTITGNELLSTEEIRKLVQLQEGGVFSRGALRNSVRAIVDRYSRAGPGPGRGRAPDRERPGEPEGRRAHPDHRGRAGLRRADQHHRQHEELGEGPAAGAARGRGRAVHLPEAGAEPPAAVQPRLLRRGERHHRAGVHARQDRREHRREGAGDRRLQHRRGLQQPRQPLRHPRHEPAEPLRPGPGGLPPVPHRRAEPAGSRSGSRSRTSSTSRSAPGSTSTTASGSTTTSRRSASAATSGRATRSRST